VTFCCYHRYRLLTRPEDIRLLLDIIGSRCRERLIQLVGYDIMPEHVHLVLVPEDTVEIGRFVGELKSHSARRILERWRSRGRGIPEALKIEGKSGTSYRFWQARCYDHNCRSPETVREKIRYCHNNPVKRGLATEPGAWPWSSYRWYHGLDGVELEIDDFGLC